jgi:type II secretory pathway pseudopilin PulG
MARANRKVRGTTLIEAVVVVAMIGLVVAVFVPPLEAVREHSCVATCLSNLRLISQAAAGYTAENGSIVFVFPFGYEVEPGVPNCPANLVTEFIWGGGLPDKRAFEWDESQGTNPLDFRPDVYVYLESERPLNEYIYPGILWCDPDRRCVNNPLRWQRPMQLPGVFRCPSDSTCALPVPGYPDDGDLPEDSDSSWEWWGTSYPVNWYWAYYYLAGGGNFVSILTGLGEQLLAQKADRGASEFILFYENRLNCAFEAAVPRGYPGGDEPRTLQGWHGQQDVHAAGFADGSARYQYFDTRYVDGPGWTLWPNRPWDETPWEPYQDY